MNNASRRRFLGLAGSTLLATQWPILARASRPSVVVIGGGAAGTIAARQLAHAGADIAVTLIERNDEYWSSLISNQLLSGMISMEPMRFRYDALRKHGINVIHDAVTDIDSVQRTITTATGSNIHYDRLILAPGIAINPTAIEGYDSDAQLLMPYAWSDEQQTTRLGDQIRAMRRGGVVIVTVPPDPICSPTAPYERASLIALYLSVHNPSAKILIVDSKDSFPMSDLFKQAWTELYPGLIEWVGRKEGGGKVLRVDGKTMKIFSSGATFDSDVANVIPPQSAGSIAKQADVHDESGWCPVNFRNFESKRQPGIYVIGDATIASNLPKNAQMANSQAKACAAAVVASLEGGPAPPVKLMSVDYKVIGKNYGISSVATYRIADDGSQILPVSFAQSPLDARPGHRNREYAYALSWYRNISMEMFG